MQHVSPHQPILLLHKLGHPFQQALHHLHISHGRKHVEIVLEGLPLEGIRTLGAEMVGHEFEEALGRILLVKKLRDDIVGMQACISSSKSTRVKRKLVNYQKKLKRKGLFPSGVHLTGMVEADDNFFLDSEKGIGGIARTLCGQ